MNRRLDIVIVLVLVLVGCSRHASPPAAPETTPAEASTSSAVAANPNAGGGNIPDPCTLLSDAEVTQLTGRDITQIDRDGADVNASTRYCQWQQSSGQLAVFISRTTADGFNVSKADTPSIPGVGDDAYFKDGHLFVLSGPLQVDVYSRGGDDAQNQTEAEKVAAAVLPKLS